MTNPNLMDDGGETDCVLSPHTQDMKLNMLAWGNPIGQSSDAPIKNNGGNGEQAADAGWDNGGTTGDDSGNAGQGKGMLDERMSEGTGLISNEFQVEVSSTLSQRHCLMLIVRSNLPTSKPTPTRLFTRSRTLTSSLCQLSRLQ